MGVGTRMWLVVAALAALLVLPSVASATEYKVTTTADHADKFCDADCSLRDAVIAAGSADSITLPAGNYKLSLGELTLTGDKINGAGARTTIIDGGGASRVLRITGDSVGSQIGGVTVTGGNGAGGGTSGQGGGIFVTVGSSLLMTDSTVRGNTGTVGGGVVVHGTFTLVGGTISGNLATNVRVVGAGGGVAVSNTGWALLGNVTVSGNTATNNVGSGQGGGILATGRLTLNNATVAGNSATSGRTLWQAAPSAAGGPTVATTMSNTILAATGAACAGPGLAAPSAITSHHDVADDSCLLTGEGERIVSDPKLGALANNGGPTDTQALLPASAAINGGGGNCATNDQRGIARPQSGACDIGAYEYRAPVLTVTTGVINDFGGTRGPGDVTVHVRTANQDVKGSPQPGSGTGTAYTLDAGSTYVVGADPLTGYSRAVGGNCDPKGAITLQEGQNRTCIVTLRDGAAALNVITEVVNDNGGTKLAADFSVHVRSGATDVFASPQPGSLTGTPFSVPAGTYVVASTMPGYTTTTSGDCDAGGTVTLDIRESKTCTVTANDVAPTLKVITTVTNDSGGTRTPSGFSVHVRKGGADVANSPKPGSSSGTTYTLSAGTYAVGPDSVVGYTTAVGGACAANGSVTLLPGDVKTCTVSGNDNAIVKQQQLPPPQPGKNVNALPKGGTVLAKLPGTAKFVLLDEDEQIPLGTVVDVRKGRVTIVAAAGDGQTADFYGGIFKLGQTKGSEPITVLTLVEKLSCPKKKSQASAAAKKKKRRLWGDGKGRFRTKGKHSAATVVGTKWLVEDRCTSTLTRVARGKVRVRDFAKKTTVLVKAPKKYVARPRR
ncbi:MAG TPA: choice-of-anchor Q domain-containing protein [Solirubrobacteraceae bacterium]|nr:choice-of-anchor Q domain-containing protein [Solirubrobacteraceae bacterium]